MNPFSDRGLTLVELSVVMVIMGILLVALGFSFVGWRDRYRAEGEIRKLYMDMMGARAKALQTKTAYFINMPTTDQYRIYEDKNDDGLWQATDRLVTAPPAMIYNVTDDSTMHFTFSKSGIADPEGTVRLADPADPDPDDGEAYVMDADYNCIAVSATRINSGLWNSATSECDER